ncbi:GGDEF domain-containing protein [Vibrio hangzhouensis]|uniref:diguanylate cyclase n=1 Tax=Vibrio hangzhouensis TaxID=462991 RepID=A0A1H5TPP6_9VIBR|nr:GGDEF domain-containing protein [Vibrio hangzhouensis]SEF64756.1 diguanylate cyclase (GGDEF) domain-containing protein [Vibrio hangzhouensis]
MLTKLEQVYEVLSCLPDPVFILSEKGDYIDLLGGTDTQSYHDGKALIGKTLHSVMSEDKANWFIGQIIDALDRNCVVTVEYDLAAAEVVGLDEHAGPAGILRFEGKIFPLSFMHNDDRVVCWLTRNISQRHQLEVQLRKQSETDGLTQIANRNYFFNRLSSITKHDVLHSLLLLDVDFFKQVNDTYGHLAGDQTLQEVVSRVQSLIRPIDIFARVGGEEFAIILPQSDDRSGYEVAERIRLAIANHPFSYKEHTFAITTSLGVTQIHQGEQNNEVFSRVDNALYLAKEQGRNRCVSLLK